MEPDICRLCLKTTSQYFSIHYVDRAGVSTSTLVKTLIPELYLCISFNPVVCKTCYSHLRAAYFFRLHCLRSENLIGIYLRERKTTTNPIIHLKSVVNFWIDHYKEKPEEVKGNLEDWFGVKEIPSGAEEPLILNQTATVSNPEVGIFSEQQKDNDIPSELQNLASTKENPAIKDRLEDLAKKSPPEYAKLSIGSNKEANVQQKAGGSDDSLDPKDGPHKQLNQEKEKTDLVKESERTDEPIVIEDVEDILNEHLNKVCTEEVPKQVPNKPPKKRLIVRTYKNNQKILPKILPKVTQRDNSTDKPAEVEETINLIGDLDDEDITSLIKELQKDENLKKLGFGNCDSNKKETYVLTKFIDKSDNSLSFALLPNPMPAPEIGTNVDDHVNKDETNLIGSKDIIKHVESIIAKNYNIINVMKDRVTSRLMPHKKSSWAKIRNIEKNDTSIQGTADTGGNEKNINQENCETVLEDVTEVNTNVKKIGQILYETSLNDKESSSVSEPLISSTSSDTTAKDVDEESLGIITFPPSSEETAQETLPLPSTSQDKPPCNPRPIIRVRPVSTLQKVRTLNHELWPQKSVSGNAEATFEASSSNFKAQPKLAENKFSIEPIVLNSKLASGDLSTINKIPPSTPNKPAVIKTYVRKAKKTEPIKQSVLNGTCMINAIDSLKNGLGDVVERRESRDESSEDAIDIKEEPLNYTESDELMDLGADDRGSQTSTESEGANTRSASETSFMETLNSQNDIVKSIVDNIPEVGEEQYDEPEYVHINNFSFSDLAKLVHENKKLRPEVSQVSTPDPESMNLKTKINVGEPTSGATDDDALQGKSPKYCFVPDCYNNTKRNPGKFFIRVPMTKEVLKLCHKAVGRQSTDVSSSYFCCEDHLDILKNVGNILKNKKFGVLLPRRWIQDIPPLTKVCSKDLVFPVKSSLDPTATKIICIRDLALAAKSSDVETPSKEIVKPDLLTAKLSDNGTPLTKIDKSDLGLTAKSSDVETQATEIDKSDLVLTVESSDDETSSTEINYPNLVLIAKASDDGTPSTKINKSDLVLTVESSDDKTSSTKICSSDLVLTAKSSDDATPSTKINKSDLVLTVESSDDETSSTKTDNPAKSSDDKTASIKVNKSDLVLMVESSGDESSSTKTDNPAKSSDDKTASTKINKSDLVLTVESSDDETSSTKINKSDLILTVESSDDKTSSTKICSPDLVLTAKPSDDTTPSTKINKSDLVLTVESSDDETSSTKTDNPAKSSDDKTATTKVNKSDLVLMVESSDDETSTKIDNPDLRLTAGSSHDGNPLSKNVESDLALTAESSDEVVIVQEELLHPPDLENGCLACNLQMKQLNDVNKTYVGTKDKQYKKCKMRTKVKYCIARSCHNNSEKCPDKTFIALSKNNKIKERWFKAVGQSKVTSAEETRHWCCEDHFDAKLMRDYRRFGSGVTSRKSFFPSLSINQPTEQTKVYAGPKVRKSQVLPKSSDDRHCFVPGCQNSSKSKRTKLFVKVPTGEQLQKQWFEAVGRRFLSVATNLWCCEDHIDIKKGWLKSTEGRITSIEMRKGVLPYRKTTSLPFRFALDSDTNKKNIKEDMVAAEPEPSEFSIICCFVPHCRQNTIESPKKFFVKVPEEEDVRRKWFESFGREYVSCTTPYFCCEDHLDVKYIATKGKYKSVEGLNERTPSQTTDIKSEPLEPPPKKFKMNETFSVR